MNQLQLGLSAIVVFFGVFGCAAPLVSPAPRTKASAATPLKPSSQRESELKSLELNSDEEILLDGLQRHVEVLTSTIGERNCEQAWALSDASDYLVGELESLGYAIERQGYEADGVTVQNLSVTVPGGRLGAEQILVGAHYDSPAGRVGVGSALATASLLELARLMHGSRSERTLRLVFFALGESPQGTGDNRGARHFARWAAQQNHRSTDAGLPEAVQKASALSYIGAVTLGSMMELIEGSSSTQAARLPVRSDQQGRKLEAVLTEIFNDEWMDLSSGDLEAVDCDACSFSQEGIPSVEIGPSSASEGSALATDNRFSERQWKYAARIVMRLRQSLGDITVERGTNDEMVTPPSF